jgi:hypothetical protein
MDTDTGAKTIERNDTLAASGVSRSTGTTGTPGTPGTPGTTGTTATGDSTTGF